MGGNLDFRPILTEILMFVVFLWDVRLLTQMGPERNMDVSAAGGLQMVPRHQITNKAHVVGMLTAVTRKERALRYILKIGRSINGI